MYKYIPKHTQICTKHTQNTKEQKINGSKYTRKLFPKTTPPPQAVLINSEKKKAQVHNKMIACVYHNIVQLYYLTLEKFVEKGMSYHFSNDSMYIIILYSCTI
jgi:hypothetical protein